MNVSVPQREWSDIRPNFPFRWQSKSIDYQGTKIPRDLTKVFKVIFPPTLRSVKVKLKKWHAGQISWFGRCQVIKMTFLPKFLYIFQTLPIKIPITFLKELNRTYSEFIWKYKTPRIPYQVLRRQKTQGELGIPDALLYYQACHLAWVLDWCWHIEQKQWVKIETQTSLVHLPGLRWCDNKIP